MKPNWVYGISLLAALGAFSAAGWTVGWFTGASETPVVGTLLPLLFGLVSGLSFGFFDRNSKKRQSLENIEQFGETAEQKQKLRQILQLDYSALWLPAYWAVGIGIFCFSCFHGTQSGISERMPKYPNINVLLQNAGISINELTPLEIAAFHRTRWQMMNRLIPSSEAESMIREVVRPIVRSDEILLEIVHEMGFFAASKKDVRGYRRVVLDMIFHDLLKEIERRRGPVPASVKLPNLPFHRESERDPDLEPAPGPA